MPRLSLIRSLPKYRAIITPARDNNWATGARAAVIDHRNSSEIKFASFAWRESAAFGKPVGEYWADVVINGVRLRMPLDFSDVTRHGGVLLEDRQGPVSKPRRGRRPETESPRNPAQARLGEFNP